MKKFIILIAVLLFGAATLFSQTYYVTVGWEDNECGCLDQGNSYYRAKVVIYDDANDMHVVSTYADVDFGTLTVNVNVPEVNTHCNRQLEYTPSFTVYAGATVYCDSYTPPEAICTTGGFDYLSNQTCTDFANNDVSITDLEFD